MRFTLTAIVLLVLMGSCREKKPGNYEKQILEERSEKDLLFKDPEQSPLDTLEGFTGLKYFPVDSSYRVWARFEKLEEDSVFEMEVSGKVADPYKRYGRLYFTLQGRPLELMVYQNLRLAGNPEYADYLFLPFKDATNGKQTYGGGRYLDLRIPESDSVLIDFNRAYNPYCAYSYKWSCPIPPRENWLDIPILAGEKALYPN